MSKCRIKVTRILKIVKNGSIVDEKQFEKCSEDEYSVGGAFGTTNILLLKYIIDNAFTIKCRRSPGPVGNKRHVIIRKKICEAEMKQEYKDAKFIVEVWVEKHRE